MVIGIDPGIRGGIAVLEDGYIVLHKPCPTIKLDKGRVGYDVPMMAKIIRDYVFTLPHVYIEDIFVPAKLNAFGAMNFGKGWGYWIGICHALELPITIIKPRDWQKKMLGDVKDTKKASIEQAKTLYPDVNLLPTDRSRKESDGLADALLIATYGENL